MSELQSGWNEAYKIAKTFCGKNATSKKAFEKLTKTLDSKLGSCLKDIDKAVDAGDRGAFDKAAAKAKPLLTEAQSAYESGLQQNLYKQNDVRAFFAAVTMTKPDSLAGKLRDLTSEMNKIAKPPSKEQLASDKADRKAAEAKQKADAKQDKKQAEYAAKMAKTKDAVLKLIGADDKAFSEYNKKLTKIKMVANERNGDLITAARAYDSAKGDQKAQTADAFREIHAACAKVVAVIGDMRKKPPTTAKSEKAAEKAYPHGRPKPKEITTGIDELKHRIEVADKELDDLVLMLNRTMGDKKPPKTDKAAEKDAKAAADAKKASDQEVVARRQGLKPRVEERKAAEAKAAKEKEKSDAKAAKRNEAEAAKARKAQEAVLKVVAADQAKLKKFTGDVRRWKMQAVGADGDLREARDAYEKDNTKAEDLKKARAACESLSAAFKKAAGGVPDSRKSEAAVDKVYRSGFIPKAVTEAVDDLKSEIETWDKELADLHIMLDKTLREIRAPA